MYHFQLVFKPLPWSGVAADFSFSLQVIKNIFVHNKEQALVLQIQSLLPVSPHDPFPYP